MDKVEKFKTWLEKRGAIVLPTTNKWEVVRFKTINGTSVIYTNKKGDLSFTNESAAAHKAWESNKVWRAVDNKRKNLKAHKVKIANRDGKRCFIHSDKKSWDQLTIEHLLSKSHGGSDNINNLVLVCSGGNHLLSNKPLSKKIEIIIQQRDRGCNE
ncbi:HNH endonuclease [Candidatus Dependentiae bacterium]|nr:MAG: HNH endonuclease [Candidatus Dependentiae bacterium]